MKIATEELRKLADHANERLLRVMPIDADMIAALAAELITARETLEEWKASQHYSKTISTQLHQMQSGYSTSINGDGFTSSPVS